MVRKKKAPIKQPVARSRKNGARKLRTGNYKSFRLSKPIKHPGPKLPSNFKILKQALLHVYREKKLFTGIIFTHLFLTVTLTRGFVLNGNFGDIKEAFSEVSDGITGQLETSVTIVGYLVDSVAPSSDIGIMYQSILLVLFSLFTIWALRQTAAAEETSLKDVFYKSSYPLVPFLGVLIIISLQLLPLLASSYLYASTLGSGISSSFAEVLAWSFLCFLLVLWSLYMVSSSVFAIYIVSLPDMTPLKALRAAKRLCQFRRWTLIRKTVYLPLVTVLTSSLLLILVTLVFAPIVEIVFLLMSSMILVLAHSYFYNLYRELLNE